MSTDNRIRALPNVKTPRKPKLTAEQEAERALHLIITEETWDELSAWGEATVRGRSEAGATITYLDALKIMDARARYDRRHTLRGQCNDAEEALDDGADAC